MAHPDVIARKISSFRRIPLDVLLKMGQDVRFANFAPLLGISAPSPKVYITEHFRNSPGRFVNISVTGTRCALRCEHCKGRLLHDMVPAQTPEQLISTGKELKKNGCRGVLISGGSVEDGYVPLMPFADAIGKLRKMGLKVIAHTGLIDRDTAIALKDAGVMQVLIDVMADTRTISEVYHLRKRPADFRKALLMMKDVGLVLAPHILLGLHYGKLRGEYRALNYVTEAEPETIIVIAITRIRGTPMAQIVPPAPEIIGRFLAVTRVLNPRIPLILGCMRQSGPEKAVVEKLALEAGVNAFAYPLDQTVVNATAMGLHPVYTEDCCSLLGETLLLR